MTFSRRTFLAGGAGLATSIAVAGSTTSLLAQPATVDIEKLMVAGPLEEKTLGSETAPVTVVEYASMTCGHCANFHNNTFKAFKEKYIDTDQVYFIFREFPLDPVAAAVFMLARCVPEERYFDVVDIFFEEQKNWAFDNNPVAALKNMALQIGISEQGFQACLTNQELLDGVNWVRRRGATEFQVTSTPTFFINGERKTGDLSIDQLSDIVESKL